MDTFFLSTYSFAQTVLLEIERCSSWEISVHILISTLKVILKHWRYWNRPENVLLQMARRDCRWRIIIHKNLIQIPFFWWQRPKGTAFTCKSSDFCAIKNGNVKINEISFNFQSYVQFLPLKPRFRRIRNSKR